MFRIPFYRFVFQTVIHSLKKLVSRKIRIVSNVHDILTIYTVFISFLPTFSLHRMIFIGAKLEKKKKGNLSREYRVISAR